MDGHVEIFFTRQARRLRMIAPFIRWLDDMDMVDFERVADDTNAAFDTRLRIQKYVFVAQYLGLDAPYRYSRHVYGPYSPALAADCDILAKDPAAYGTESDLPMPAGFRQDEFLRTVKGRDSEWLEVATTLIYISPQHDNAETVLDHAAWIKKGIYAVDYIAEVLGDLLKLPVGKSVSH